MNDLGALYYMGDLVEQDYAKAAELYEMAADAGCFQSIINGQRSVAQGVFFHQFPALGSTFLIKSKRFLAAVVRVEVEKDIVDSKTDFIDPLKEFFFRSTLIRTHHRLPPRFPQNGLQSSGKTVPTFKAYPRS